MSIGPVYLDCHATTPLDPRVLDAMLPFFREHFGNAASSTHAWGWKAQSAIEASRRDVAALVGASPREVVFTSGATESNNLAIFGAAGTAPSDRRHVVVSAIEHKSVLEAAHRLAVRGWRVTEVGVSAEGRIDLDALARAVDPTTRLVSVMAANNEVGAIQPLAEIGEIAKRAGSLFHVDAAQAVGKTPVDVGRMGIDLLSLTGHKIHGPKGSGALIVKRRLELEPMLVGGGHERGVRAGTLNVPGIVGLGTACALAREEGPRECPRIAGLRDRLAEGLTTRVGRIAINGSIQHRLPNNLHVTFDGVDGEDLMIAVGDVAVSTGSACASASATPSHVLTAMFGEGRVPSACIRFGLGRFTTDAEIDYAIDKFAAVVGHLRQTAPR